MAKSAFIYLLIGILVFSWLSALCSLPHRHPRLAGCRQQHHAGGIHTGTAPEAHPRTPHWTGPSRPTTAWTETKPVRDWKCAVVKRKHITKIKSSDNFVLSSRLGHHLSLDDVEEEVWVAAATEEVSQTE